MTTKDETDNLILGGIKTLLDVSPLYGNIVMNLTREMNLLAPHPLALKWQNHRWYLVINPARLTENFSTYNQIAAALAHEALHVIWEHPVRYAVTHQAKSIVDLGTDVAINQYLPKELGELPTAVTLQMLFDVYGEWFAPYQDSQTYIDLISRFEDDVPAHGDVDGHGDWASVGDESDEAKSALEQVIRQANEDAQKSARGHLASAVIQQISAVVVPKKNWRQIFKTGVSQVPNQKQPSRARFNRRQAYRMDLFGEISTYENEILVFVDNSASISDKLVGKFLANVMQITQQFDAKVRVFSFDTAVEAIKNINHWQRRAGGGTAFQSIFDYLDKQKTPRETTTVIILTDGDGETSPIMSQYRRVYWILPEHQQLSLPNQIGKVLTL